MIDMMSYKIQMRDTVTERIHESFRRAELRDRLKMVMRQEINRVKNKEK